MNFDEQEVLGRFHRALVREIHARNPEHLNSPFTVAEIYQNLVPYRTHRDEIGLEMNADYEHVLLRLLAGEGDYLDIESRTARQEIREELDSPNPNIGLYRDFAAADVRLNPEKLDPSMLGDTGGPSAGVPPMEDEPLEVEYMDEGVVGEHIDGDGTAEGAYERLEVEPLGANLGPVADDEEPDSLGSADFSMDLTEGALEDEAGGTAGEGEDGLPHFENCPWCREKLPQQARVRFCPFCGSNVQLVPCPSCGEELRLNWRFCIACGTEVES